MTSVLATIKGANKLGLYCYLFTFTLKQYAAYLKSNVRLKHDLGWGGAPARRVTEPVTRGGVEPWQTGDTGWGEVAAWR